MTVAEKVIKPTKSGIFRTVFLYTGQGESTLLVIPKGPSISDYMYVLVDCDRDKEKNEIDLVEMFKDLFKNAGELSVFINTHPHNDHIGGIKDVYDEIGFSEVWHSNHKPGPKHKEKYEDLKYVIDKVGNKNEFFLLGTNDLNKVRTSDDKEKEKKIGDIDYQVLSPAEYLCDDIMKKIKIQETPESNKPRQSEWEAKMSKFQSTSENATADQKWQLMQLIYKMESINLLALSDRFINQTT